MKDEILKLLSNRRDMAITSFALAEAIGLDPERTSETVRSLIRELIAEGTPICSCPDGYYIAASATEVLKCVRSLRVRIKGINERIDDLIDAWENR